MKANRTRLHRIRIGVQIFFFLLIALIALGHSLEEAGIVIPLIGGPSLHAVCPFGGVVSIYQLIVAGSFIQKIHASSFILMVLVFLTTLLFGPIFCGWVCPLGSFQEWIGKIGRRIFKRRWNHMLPTKLDRVLRYLRYGVLVWVIVVTAVSVRLFFVDYDPYYALFNFWTGEVTITGFAILAVVIFLSLIMERPFCKYACPYGALLGVFNLFRIFSVRRNAPSCISCSACSRACPMNIDVEHGRTIRSHQCISCYECTSDRACPIPQTVEVSAALPQIIRTSQEDHHAN